MSQPRRWLTDIFEASAWDGLVTGGAGFIGSSLCKRLLAEGLRVRALDDLSSGSEENVSALMNQESFHLFFPMCETSRYSATC